MTTPIQSDALVFFGATGDLAYKQIFPALQALVKHGHLNVPVIGVAKAGWNLDQLKARAHDSLCEHGGVDSAAWAKLSGLLRYIDGDYADIATFQALRKELGAIHNILRTIWRFRRCSLKKWLSNWSRQAVPRGRVSSSKSRSATTWQAHRN